LSGFSPMAPLEGVAAEMATRQCSTEVTGGAPMGDGSGHEEKRLEPGWVQWIMGVLSSHLLYGRRVVEDGRSWGGRRRQWNFNGTDYRRRKWGMGGDGMGCGHFQMERGGGGEAAPWCQRQMTQRRVARQPGRLKAAAGVWRSKMTKGNWVDGLMKKYGREYEMGQKDRRRNTGRPK
jgi:hypothetical protein